MPRQPRLLLSQSYYHIMTRGNNKNIVFKCDADYQYYLSLILRYKAEHSFELYHYCLMSNHTHFLVKTKKAKNFSVFMKKINLAYFHHYRQEYGWIGHFWQGRYKSKPVGRDEYFIEAGKYIELNPVRKGIVNNPDNYPYSSYRYYAYGDNNQLITEDVFYCEMGKSNKDCQEKYKELIVSEIMISNYKKTVWGTPKECYKESQKIKRYLK
ncbi:MAG: putative transposase [Candidatus Berkelbacteria bacterium Licking1014_85]|uniref:Putative transposase n=1 Tax=Candidatus Berkelbacteria bacterium Licking1014_85 TaxID=2017148 RepID=A0A554LKX1_9BACT|nr:MAG: putative transposase [Candidatus Berkelbacteria bacterium Licking1014_85]